jgi:hypothetical protein
MIWFGLRFHSHFAHFTKNTSGNCDFTALLGWCETNPPSFNRDSTAVGCVGFARKETVNMVRIESSFEIQSTTALQYLTT